jgi:hypothetical protein
MLKTLLISYALSTGFLIPIVLVCKTAHFSNQYGQVFNTIWLVLVINLLTLQAKKKMVDKSLKVESLEFKVDSSYFVLSAR